MDRRTDGQTDGRTENLGGVHFRFVRRLFSGFTNFELILSVFNEMRKILKDLTCFHQFLVKYLKTRNSSNSIHAPLPWFLSIFQVNYAYAGGRTIKRYQKNNRNTDLRPFDK